MPLKLASTSRDDINRAVFYWMELLADEKYVEAYELTMHDPYYGWTPLLLESIISGYGLPYEPGEEVFKVTSPQIAIVDSSSHVVYNDITFFEEPKKYSESMPEVKRIGCLFYDLPLNGKWSDLSVTFTLLQVDVFLMLELNEIHIF